MSEPHDNVAKLQKTNNVIAVASGKGGVGKTFFAIALTQALAQRGQHPLLFDADLGLANIDIQLGLTPRIDLAQVLEGKATLKQACQPYRDGGFDVIAGRSGSGSLANLPSQRLTALRDELMVLARSYDRVVVDLAAGVDRAVRVLASRAGKIVIITTDEPTSITDAYAFIKVAQHANPNIDIQVVVNMARSNHDGQRTFDTLQRACSAFLKFSPSYAGHVRRDDHVADAIRAQMPFMQRYPTSETSSDIDKVARTLLR